MQVSCIQAGVYLQVKIVPWYTQFVIFLFYMDLNVDFYFYIWFLFSIRRCQFARVIVDACKLTSVVTRLTDVWFRILYGRSKLVNKCWNPLLPRDVFGLRKYPDGHTGYYRNSICPEDGIILYHSGTENLKQMYHSRYEKHPAGTKSIPGGFWRPGSIWSKRDVLGIAAKNLPYCGTIKNIPNFPTVVRKCSFCSSKNIPNSAR